MPLKSLDESMQAKYQKIRRRKEEKEGREKGGRETGRGGGRARGQEERKAYQTENVPD